MSPSAGEITCRGYCHAGPYRRIHQGRGHCMLKYRGCMMSRLQST